MSESSQNVTRSGELLPCPFCGGEAEAVHEINGFWTVECIKCGALVDGIAAWNTRAERTCHIVRASRKYVLSDGTELFEDGCSECNGYLDDGDNYCPNCGARVVDE